jgi:hypothetical protein
MIEPPNLLPPDDPNAEAVAQLLRTPYIIRAVRQKHGDDFLRTISADTCAVLTEYVYFGYTAREAALAARSRLQLHASRPEVTFDRIHEAVRNEGEISLDCRFKVASRECTIPGCPFDDTVGERCTDAAWIADVSLSLGDLQKPPVWEFHTDSIATPSSELIEWANVELRRQCGALLLRFAPNSSKTQKDKTTNPKETPNNMNTTKQCSEDIKGFAGDVTVYFRYRYDKGSTSWTGATHYGHRVVAAAESLGSAIDQVMAEEKESMIGHAGDQGMVEFVYATNNVDPDEDLWMWECGETE